MIASSVENRDRFSFRRIYLGAEAKVSLKTGTVSLIMNFGGDDGCC